LYSEISSATTFVKNYFYIFITPKSRSIRYISSQRTNLYSNLKNTCPQSLFHTWSSFNPANGSCKAWHERGGNGSKLFLSLLSYFTVQWHTK